MSAVKKNDRLGWGIFYADEEISKDQDQLMICFLTINRQVVYLRVLFQPPGGFYPVVIAPPNGKKFTIDRKFSLKMAKIFFKTNISII